MERLRPGKLLDDPTKADLKRRKEKLEEEIKEYFQKIIEVRKRLASAKQGIMNKCIDEVGGQVNKAIGLQKNIYNEIKSINAQQFGDRKATLDKRIGQCEIKLAGYQERQGEVNQRMKLINADGINPSTANILIGVGTSVAAAAGYFFSVFTSTANFSNQDAFYFLLNGFLKVGGTDTVGFLSKAGILVLFVFLIGLISCGCYWFLNKLFGAKKHLKEDYTRFDAYTRMVKENNSVSAEIKAGSWFSLWLQISPVVIILGIVVLLLALNKTSGDDVMRLNSSLEGALAGTAVALGVGGLMCLYSMKIIEPRLLQKRNEQKSIVNWLKYNWELAACMLAFIVFTLAIIFFPINNGKIGDQSTNAIAIPEFIVISLLSAFPFAYGIRFRGLIAVNRFLQREIDRLDDFIAESKTAQRPEENNSYKKVNDLVEGLLTAMQNRVLLLQAGSSNENNAAVIRNQRSQFFAWRSFKKFFLDLFNARNSADVSPIHKVIALTDWEKRYFPDLDEEMKLIGAECIEKEQEYKKVQNQLDKLDAEYSTLEEDAEEKNKKLQKDIETLLTYKEKAEASKIKKFAQFSFFSTNAETAILDGFHLGIWYRENQIGPSDGYYINTTTLTDNYIDPTIKLLSND